ncbi:tRNA (adenosine(37)-N6)-threonylcarbamoyltransferase complex transferase subunit TsaD [Candidatus Roizmanbacteria bacterium]|nr:tRNA (adenosine(37)-N6)-threonylcarbamoyltransferase complex transferase subunit TsaD [Candidatus Roizmanbacteria bacterium]
MKKHFTILAIETSLDETCAAVTIDDRIISNVVSSQVDLHKKWGGVVPVIAKRAHEERIDGVLKEALKQANSTLKKLGLSYGVLSEQTVDAIAVTLGPGQALALEVGIRKAKEIALKFNKPLITVSHMEGHLLSSFAKNAQGNNRSGADLAHIQFPLMGLLISGGHTQLVLVTAIGEYELLGETLDDSIGEAFDKVGRMLGLGYPGGPIIERLAKEGNEQAFNLPVPMKGRNDLAFSYSGLKTAVRYLTDELREKNQLNRRTIQDVSASFQRVATASLIDRLERAVSLYKPNGLLLGGGVISNVYVRNKIRSSMKVFTVPVYIPYTKKLFTDNAGMIGVAAYCKAKRNEFVSDIYSIDRKPNLNFTPAIV